MYEWRVAESDYRFLQSVGVRWPEFEARLDYLRQLAQIAILQREMMTMYYQAMPTFLVRPSGV
jgi:hypothetical protein